MRFVTIEFADFDGVLRRCRRHKAGGEEGSREILHMMLDHDFVPFVTDNRAALAGARVSAILNFRPANLFVRKSDRGPEVSSHASCVEPVSHLACRGNDPSVACPPPSISIMVPLTIPMSGEASITTRFATSSTSEYGPSGSRRLRVVRLLVGDLHVARHGLDQAAYWDRARIQTATKTDVVLAVRPASESVRFCRLRWLRPGRFPSKTV